MDNPLVSVVMPTYNHAPYIAQAIEGASMQKTDFHFEILIGEDDSSDNTREICKEYAAKYPDKIRLFLNDRKNVIYIGGQPTGRWNFHNLLTNSKGKYIAICDGDDYWTNPLKLQKQVDFLEANRDFIVHHHNVMIVDKQGNGIKPFLDFRRKIKPETDLSDYLSGGIAGITCSMLFRWNHEIKEGPVKIKYMDDNVLYAYLLSLGFKAKYSSEMMACYRIHPGGIWSIKSEKANALLSVRTYKGLLQVCRNQRFLYNQLFSLVRLYIRLSSLSDNYKDKYKYIIFAIKSLFSFSYLHYKDFFTINLYTKFLRNLFIVFISLFPKNH